MPKLIDTTAKLLKSSRFVKGLSGKQFSDDELVWLDKLFTHILTKNIKLMSDSGSYSIFMAIVNTIDENAITRFDFLKSNATKRTKETYIARHGELNGNKKWNEYVEKQRCKNLFESKQKSHGWSREQFDEFNKSRSVTLALCIKRHGIEEGTQKWEHYVDRQRITNTLEYFLEKNGPAGYDLWLAYNKSKGNSSNIEWVMQAYNISEDAAREKIAAQKHPKFSSSPAELYFVNLLEIALGYEIPYTAKTKQFSIWNKQEGGILFYDIVDTAYKKIIEFHGDYWHCNPKEYAETYYHAIIKKTAKEIWHKDFNKVQVAIDRGFTVKIVWWSDFISSPDEIIKEAAEWMKT
jgi:hypothetical protein